MTFVWMTGCAASNKHAVKVSSEPPGAMVSVVSADAGSALNVQAVAGTTPLEKTFDFGGKDRLQLQIEKRGYAPKHLDVTADTGNIAVNLDRLRGPDGAAAPEFALPTLRRILLVLPEVIVIQRGFSSETVAEDQSRQAQQALSTGIAAHFQGRSEIVTLSNGRDAAQVKTLWRDVHTAMELTDPIRLQYLPEPLILETSGSRMAAQNLGRQYGVDVILLVSGKQITETAGMVAGKIALTAVGTAASYAGAYSRAVANGDSLFVYSIFIPQFSQGTFLKAMMIDCRNGEVLWTNGGLWPAFDFQDAAMVGKVISDLLTNLER